MLYEIWQDGEITYVPVANITRIKLAPPGDGVPAKFEVETIHGDSIVGSQISIAGKKSVLLSLLSDEVKP